jgi:hypothetical protein
MKSKVERQAMTAGSKPMRRDAFAWRTVVRLGLVIAGLLLGCTRVQISGPGTGSDTPNSICGLLVSADGRAASNTVVRLVPHDYDAFRDKGIISVAVDTTSAAGEYSFDGIDTGAYNIEAVQLSERTRTLIYGIEAGADTVKVGTDTLRRTGTMKIELPQPIDPISGYVYIPGTTIAAPLDGERDLAVVDSVPAGVVPAIVYAAADTDTSVVLRQSVAVAAGDTVGVFNPGWKFCRRLRLNTSSSGAAVAGTVTDFPVLVRLHDGNFPFGQAVMDGTDLRFTKADGTELRFESAWDNGARRAEVWVSVDTIYGNNATQEILMYWGNPDAPQVSSGPAVFDSVKGFAAVWHMDASIGDATDKQRHGSDYGTADTVGIIGSARKFDGGDSIKVAGLMGTPPDITLSAWVVVDSATYNGGEVLSVGDAVLLRTDALIGSTGVHAAFHALADDSTFGVTTSGRYLAKSGWHFVAYTFDDGGNKQSLYIDGVPVASQDSVQSIVYSGLGTSTFLGYHANGKNTFGFRGSIDEARVCRVARSADWLRLCYMNQKADDALVVFR